jgi:hypothetical protein
MSTATPVVRARWCDIGHIADLVAEALSPTALAAWLVPDTQRRTAVLAAVARIWTEHAMLFGDAFLLPDGTAATLWFHRYRPIPAPHRYADRLAAAAGPDEERFLRLDEALAVRRPAEAHNHLALLAAPGPAATRRAAAVLVGAQRWMDTLSLPTYAEVFTETDRDLFRQHGYTDREAFAGPGDTTTHPMWRLSPFRANRSGANGRWPTRRITRTRNGRATGWALR